MRININTTLLADLWINANNGNLEEIQRITSKLREYERLRLLAKQEYQKGNKTQYRAINEQIERFIADNDLSIYTD